MEMDAEGNDDRQINAGADGEVGAGGVPYEVVTGVDERAHGRQHGRQHGLNKALDIAQCMLKEKIAEYSADVEAYKARISHLESMFAEFGIRPNESSSCAPLLEAEDVDCASQMVHASV